MTNIDTATSEELRAWIDYLETKVQRLQGNIEHLQHDNFTLRNRVILLQKNAQRT